MIKFFRNIRHTMIKSNRFSKYLLYAIGEIILVVIGILIALQINNTNQNHIEDKTLWGYLNNIKANIQNDLTKAKNMNFVLDQLASNTPLIWQARAKDVMSLQDIQLAEDHLNTLFYREQFRPTTYGFETLKSTGYIGKLQGTDMEVLLFSYYSLTETLREWNLLETEFLKDVLKEQQKTDYGFSDEVFYNFLKDTTLVVEIRDGYKKMLNSPTYDSALAIGVFNEFFPLFLELKFLGKTIVSLIDQRTLDASEDIMRSVELYNSDFSNTSQEEVVIEGILPKNVTIFTASNLGFDAVKTDAEENYIEFDVQPGLEWAAAMFVVDSLGQNIRAGKDYSKYKSIQVELRSDQEGEEIMLSLKDKFDKDDGTEARVDIRLSQEWKTYRFNLEESFPTADLSNLHQLAGFVILNPKGLKIYVRNIKFLLE
ncbi:MAG: DUF6090 family protein [Flavobacteriaceae bacterium]|nr:DUF6090 family protein [Flavobacteriaceae bacterium]